MRAVLVPSNPQGTIFAEWLPTTECIYRWTPNETRCNSSDRQVMGRTHDGVRMRNTVSINEKRVESRCVGQQIAGLGSRV